LAADCWLGSKAMSWPVYGFIAAVAVPPTLEYVFVAAEMAAAIAAAVFGSVAPVPAAWLDIAEAIVHGV